jgi:ribosomal protein S18 acetylase RimI-like enzyme
MYQDKQKEYVTDISIRQATEVDLPGICPLILELFEVMDSPPDTRIQSAVENCRAVIQDSRNQTLVATSGDSVVGFINFTTRRTIAHARPSALIDELVVAGRFRSQGIGKRLVSAAIQMCQDLGCDEIEVSTEKENTKARDFYKNCGFDEDAVLLERELGD